MRSTGATPALFGACLACAATGGLCFTAVPHVGPPRPSGTLSGTSSRHPPSARLDATRASSGKGDNNSSSRSSISGDGRKSNFDRLLSRSAGTTPGSSDSTRRQRQKSRRKTLLSSTKETSSRTSSSATIDKPPGWTTSQQFEAEVAARRASGARFPPALGYGFEDDDRSRSSSRVSLEPSEPSPRLNSLQEDVPTLPRTRAAGNGSSTNRRSRSGPANGSSVSGQTTTAAAAAAAGHVAEETTTTTAAERQRLLDMTTPPAELREAAKTRSVGEGEAATVGTKGVTLTPEEGGVAEGATDGGVDLWASRGMLAGAAMLYGTNFGCVKLLEETVPMSLAAALRFSVALVPFLPFLRKIKPEVFKAGAEIGLLNAVGYWAQSESLMTTTASKSAFICSLSVIFVPLMDAVLGALDGKEAKAAKAVEAAEKKSQGGVFAGLNGPWFPALLAAAGVACLELIGVEGGPNSGDVWALAQPLCFGVGFWLTERCSRKYPEETFGIVAAQLLTVAVLAIGWCAQAGHVPVSFESLHETVMPSSGSLAVPLSLLWTGLVTTALTVFGETMAMKKISAAESTIILSTEPIWGTAFAAVLLGETIGWNTGLGAALIVSACTWSSVGPAIQSKLLSLIAATGAAGTSAGVDVDDLTDTVGTVIKELAKENIEL